MISCYDETCTVEEAPNDLDSKSLPLSTKSSSSDKNGKPDSEEKQSLRDAKSSKQHGDNSTSGGEIQPYEDEEEVNEYSENRTCGESENEGKKERKKHVVATEDFERNTKFF